MLPEQPVSSSVIQSRGAVRNTNIHALHKLALELVQSFRCLSEAKTALDFLNTSDANCRALKTVMCSGTWGPGRTGVSHGNQPIVVPLACDYRVL